MKPDIVGRTDGFWERQRLSLRIRAAEPDVVVAWSENACRAALAARSTIRVGKVFYRPSPQARRPVTEGIALCHSSVQHEALGGHVLPRPVPKLDRISIGDNVFRWMLPNDASGHVDLRTAIWAGALVRLAARSDGRAVRLVLPPSTRWPFAQARRFADQLGIPSLVEPWHATSYVEAARRCDGLVCTPTGPCDTWPVRLARQLGLAIASTPAADVREAAGEAEVFEAESSQVRHVAKAMLQATNHEKPPKPSRDATHDAASVREAFAEIVHSN
ncbi:MAG: hypothetical protein AAGI46_12390 [Planctomycetota bacterium]